MGSSIVNGWAFVVVGIAGLFYFATNAVAGGVAAEGRGPLLMGVLIVISALLCEWRGLAGRLLGAPLWIWGTALAMVGLLRAFGPIALAPTLGALLLGGLVYWRQRRRGDDSVWPAAQSALERAGDASAAADLGGTWAALASALTLPAPPWPGPEEAAALGAHLLTVVELVRATFGATLSEAQRARLEVLKIQLSGPDPALTPEDHGWLVALVRGRGL
jgi:hypothetical protein